MLESSGSHELSITKEELYNLLDAMSTYIKHENDLEMNSMLGELLSFMYVCIMYMSCITLSGAFFFFFFFFFFAADLCKKCKTDSNLRSQVEYAIYHFPGVVTAAHKRHDTPPHLIFAVENLVRMAVNEVLRILSPGTLCMLFI